MRFSSVILLTLLFNMLCLSKSEKKKLSLKSFDDSTRYNTYWDQYYLAKPVPVHVLQEILNTVTLYSQDEHCPFGVNECDHVNTHQVTRRVAKDTAKEFEHFVGDNNGEVKRGKQHTLRDIEILTEPIIGLIGNDIQKLLEYTSHIQREIIKSKELTGITYKHIKVPRNINQKHIIKRFGPVRV